MSNAGSTWRKFVQTFFLAEQPNGYFVLNDIFRFLKEESVEGESEDGDGEREAFGHASNEPEQPAPVEAEQVQEQATVDEPTAPTTDTYERSAAPSPSPEPTPAPELAPVPEPRVETPAPVVEAAPAPTPAPAPAPPQVNGVHAVPEPEVIEPPKPSTPAPAVSAPTPPPAASPAPALPIAQPAAPTTAPRPAQPAPPKTWANLAAANSKKWGSAVAQESRGTTEVPVAAHPHPAPRGPAPGSAPASAAPPRGQGTATPPRGAQGRQGGQGNGEHSALVAAQTVTTAACFVKVCFLSYITVRNIYINLFSTSSRELLNRSHRQYLQLRWLNALERSKTLRSSVTKPARSWSSLLLRAHGKRSLLVFL